MEHLNQNINRDMIKIAKEKRTFATKFKQMLMKETLKSYFGYDSFGYGRLYIVSYYGA